RGVSATTNHAGNDWLWVFTSSTSFDANRSYDKFGAYAVLNHAGDLAAAARALSEQGYGTPLPASPRRDAGGLALVPATTAQWRWLADVPREHVKWVWHGRIAAGKLIL